MLHSNINLQRNCHEQNKGGRGWQPFDECKNGYFRKARKCYFCVALFCSHNHKFANSIQYLYNIPCNSALLAQETMKCAVFFTQALFCPKSLKKYLNCYKSLYCDKIADVRAQNFLSQKDTFFAQRSPKSA